MRNGIAVLVWFFETKQRRGFPDRVRTRTVSVLRPRKVVELLHRQTDRSMRLATFDGLQPVTVSAIAICDELSIRAPRGIA